MCFIHSSGRRSWTLGRHDGSIYLSILDPKRLTESNEVRKSSTQTLQASVALQVLWFSNGHLLAILLMEHETSQAAPQELRSQNGLCR